MADVPEPTPEPADELDPAPGPDAPITNIFVLMLENHSFDNVFAMSGIPGIVAATTDDANSWLPPDEDEVRTVHVTDGAPWSMTTDPGHEFDDVMQQLSGVQPCPTDPDAPTTPCADDAHCYHGGPYPEIDLEGFACNYAWSTSEGTGRPTTRHVGDVMACFDTPRQLPVIHQLATEFAVCDAWHSSLPGPTWPNRFFVHGASSAGMSQSPSSTDEIIWETVRGFRYGNGSIFHALTEAGHRWRLYQDKDNDFSDKPSPWRQGGWISQVASLKGISLLDVHSLRGFRDDLHRHARDGRPAYLDVPYTFIEPNFGASFCDPQGDDPGPTYRGGSAQHPEDDPTGGERLVKAVYEAIRSSPVWETSVLVVVYDEHGGFFDSVAPGPAVPPGDDVPHGHDKLNRAGFDFSQYGVRVPAVVVSPRIPRGTVDHTLYDHTSVLATLERVLCLAPLTARDAAANDVRHLLSLSEPRTDCPVTLTDPVVVPTGPDATDPTGSSPTATAAQALPGPSNVAGFLHVLLKAELELDGHDDESARRIVSRFAEIRTMGDAVAYVHTIGARLDEHRGQPSAST